MVNENPYKDQFCAIVPLDQFTREESNAITECYIDKQEGVVYIPLGKEV